MASWILHAGSFWMPDAADNFLLFQKDKKVPPKTSVIFSLQTSLSYPHSLHFSLSQSFKSDKLSPSLLLFPSSFTSFNTNSYLGLNDFSWLWQYSAAVRKNISFTCFYFSLLIHETKYTTCPPVTVSNAICSHYLYWYLGRMGYNKLQLPHCKLKISFSWHLATLRYLC